MGELFQTKSLRWQDHLVSRSFFFESTCFRHSTDLSDLSVHVKNIYTGLRLGFHENVTNTAGQTRKQ